EIAFVGRSNAGKSTAINTLAQQRRLAFASRTPGRTQHINLFEVGPRDRPDLLFADLPGYGYAAVERAAKLRWQAVMADYLQLRRPLHGVVLMIDSRLGFTDLDRRLLALMAPRLSNGEVRLLVLLTKADKLNKRNAQLALTAAQAVLAEVSTEAADIAITLFSALSKQGLEDVATTLHGWIPRAVSAPLGDPEAPIRCFDLPLPHGITLACRAPAPPPSTAVAAPADGPAHGSLRVMLLHGFPEAAFVWDDVMRLVSASLPHADLVAPNLRGFPGSSAPVDLAAYRARPLVQDLIAAIEHRGSPLDLLVAHDWGGALAWNLAAARPDLLRQLLIINSPHPAAFLRELRDNPAQQAASAYMNFLCRPDAAALLSANHWERLWRFMGPTPWMTPDLCQRYEAAWGEHGAGLEGPLNYYRASPLRPPMADDDALLRLQLPDAIVHVAVPTMVLWGERDQALLPGLLDGLEHWVPALQIVRVPDAGHWIVHEQPERVAQTIMGLLSTGAQGRDRDDRAAPG
ncbi:MAG: ribosome biogenesis GTP-binding protein YihA/YsxC, partial [Rubrivivax sp.]